MKNVDFLIFVSGLWMMAPAKTGVTEVVTGVWWGDARWVTRACVPFGAKVLFRCATHVMARRGENIRGEPSSE